jgi:hypothetical protein
MGGDGAVFIECYGSARSDNTMVEFEKEISRSFHLIDVDGDNFIMSSDLTFAGLQWPEDAAHEIFGGEEEFHSVVDPDDLGTVTKEDFTEILLDRFESVSRLYKLGSTDDVTAWFSASLEQLRSVVLASGYESEGKQEERGELLMASLAEACVPPFMAALHPKVRNQAKSQSGQLLALQQKFSHLQHQLENERQTFRSTVAAHTVRRTNESAEQQEQVELLASRVAAQQATVQMVSKGAEAHAQKVLQLCFHDRR